MKAELVKTFSDLGFHAEDTGGGCQWLRKDIGCGLSLVVTDGEAGLPDHEAQLFVMTDKHSDPLAHGKLTPTQQLIDDLHP